MSRSNPRGAVDALPSLAAGLMPALLHRLANTTQILTGLNSLAALGLGPEMWVERADDVDAASEQAHELGYLLAVVGSGAGADLLGERRAPQGLRWTVGLLREGLRRRSLDLGPDPAPWPELCPAAPAGWRLPWAVAELIWLASVDSVASVDGAAGNELIWSLETGADGHLLCVTPLAPAAASVPDDSWRRSLVERLPGATLECLAHSWRLHIPFDWLTVPAAAATGDETTTGGV
ncbi:MAG: hypothetical protein QF724_05145 [Planctomycetota bacterium]|nr:hypothetical protein [Planctomycetota bacterium]